MNWKSGKEYYWCSYSRWLDNIHAHWLINCCLLPERDKTSYVNKRVCVIMDFTLEVYLKVDLLLNLICIGYEVYLRLNLSEFSWKSLYFFNVKLSIERLKSINTHIQINWFLHFTLGYCLSRLRFLLWDDLFQNGELKN